MDMNKFRVTDTYSSTYCTILNCIQLALRWWQYALPLKRSSTCLTVLQELVDHNLLKASTMKGSRVQPGSLQ